MKKRQAKETQDRILYYLRNKVNLVFGIELDTIHESGTQDEVVRLVNLLAIETSVICVHQDKGKRKGNLHAAVDGDVYSAKRKWSEARNLALQICPELEERLPHFSEFEPLKSYNAEHLLQKKVKRETAQK